MPALKKPAEKRNAKTSRRKKAFVPLHSKHTDWVDKQEIMDHFHLSERTLQNLRSRNEITWSTIGGKIYYNIPSFTAVLEKNRRG